MTCSLALLLSYPLYLSSAVAGPAGDGNKLFEDALSRYESRDYNGAVIQLKNVLQANRNLLQAHVLLGKVLQAKGEMPGAEAAFNEALKLGVNRAEVVVPLAQVVVAQGHQQEVVDQPRFALAQLPANVQAKLLLIKSAALSDLGDAKGALKAVEDARALDAGNLDTWLAEVPVRIRARQIKEALAVIDKARSMAPQSAEMHYQHGSVLHVQGNLPAAQAAYELALAADAKHADARVAHAGLMIDQKQTAAADKDVALLLEHSPSDPRGWYLSALLAERAGRQAVVKQSMQKITTLLDPVPIDFIRYRPQMLLLNGQAHYALGEREKARPLFEAFVRVQPVSPVPKLLANIYLIENAPDRAVDLLEPYLRRFPTDAQAMALLATAHMAKGRHARAATLMQEALKSQDSPQLQTTYGMSLLGAGQSDNAQGQLEAAFKKDPGQLQAGFALIGIYLKSNQGAKALPVAMTLNAKHPGNPSVLNMLGLSKARQKDVAGARKAFEQAIEQDGSLTAARINLARLEAQTKNADKAQAQLEEALKRDPNHVEATFEMAVLAERRNRPEDALRWLTKAFDLSGPKDSFVGLALVDLHQRQGRLAEAVKINQQLLATKPDDMRVLLAMTRLQMAGKDLAGARNTLGTATRLAGFDGPMQVEIALLQLAIQNPAGAQYSLEKALSNQADFFPAMVMMAEVQTKLGDHAKAEQLAQQIIKKEPRQAIGHSLMGDVLLAKKQALPAVEAYKRAFQVQPTLETMTRLFLTQMNVDPKQAMLTIDGWLRGHPADHEARKLLAEGKVRTGNLAGAKTDYEKLHQALPRDVAVVNNLANVLLTLKDPQASAIADKALAMSPTSPAVIDTAGWAAMQAGNTDRAIQLLRDARLRDPENGSVRFHLASALVKTGRTKEAKDELDVALRTGNGFDGRQQALALQQTLR